jgi:hypothetical protein
VCLIHCARPPCRFSLWNLHLQARNDTLHGSWDNIFPQFFSALRRFSNLRFQLNNTLIDVIVHVRSQVLNIIIKRVANFASKAITPLWDDSRSWNFTWIHSSMSCSFMWSFKSLEWFLTELRRFGSIYSWGLSSALRRLSNSKLHTKVQFNDSHLGVKFQVASVIIKRDVKTPEISKKVLWEGASFPPIEPLFLAGIIVLEGQAAR